MRESIGGAMMLRIFLIIIVMFVIFLCLSANFARAFKIKNGVIDIIEKYQGINNKSISLVNSYVNRMGYTCKTADYSTVKNYVLMDKDNEPILYGNYYGKKSDGTFDHIVGSDNDKHLELNDRIYNVQVCIDWNIPVIGILGKWTIKGETELISNTYVN